MPTAGEARLKGKSVKKTSEDRVSLKEKAAEHNKIPGAKKKIALHPSSEKTLSSIPVPIKKGAKEKENADPNVGPVGKPRRKASKVKKAPDFSKLHRKWEDQLSKGKAVTKKKNTTAEPFNLTKKNQQTHKFRRPYAYNSEDEETVGSDDEEDVFEIDSTALKGILNDTGIKDEDLKITGRATIAAIPSSKSSVLGQSNVGLLKRTSIYYTGPTTQHARPLKPCNIDTARSQASSCAKKQVAWADQALENDAFDFQPDFSSLQSILSNTGIDDHQMRVQNTSRVTLAGGRLTPYRRCRQAFREEPSKRTSIYYTGPKCTRPSPRPSGLGRASVLRTRQATEGSAATNSTYNPLTTVVGRQGNLEQDENDPIATLAARQFPSRTPAPDSQPLGSNPVLTPARKLVLNSQPSSNRDQPSWADIFTPQRAPDLQESAKQVNRPQPSLDPLRTPGKQQPFQEEMFTPQRVLAGVQNRVESQETIHSTLANSSTASVQQPLVDSKRQLHSTCISTPQSTAPNIPQFLSTRSVDFQSRHAPLTTQDWQGQTRPQAQAVSYQPPAKTLFTPARQGPFVAQSINSNQPQQWSDIFTPQRGPLIPLGSRQQTTAQVACSFNESLVTPLRQGVPVSHASCMRNPPSTSAVMTPKPGTSFQDLGSRPQCSTVQITSFQPSPKKEVSGSIEFRLPQQIPETQNEHLKCVTTKEEEDIAKLERQALEDLGLLHITETSHTETPSETRGNVDKDSPSLHVPNTWITGDHCVTDCPENITLAEPRSRPVPSGSSSESVVPTLEQHRTSFNVASTCPEGRSGFYLVARFANPTPVKGYRSVTGICSTLKGSSSVREGRGLVNSRGVHANSLSLRSAISSSTPTSLVKRNTTLRSEGSLRFCWEPNIADDLTSASRPTSSAFQKTPRALAQEALLDMEVSTYMMTSHGRLMRSEGSQRPMNPLARVFVEGDSTHFLSIN